MSNEGNAVNIVERLVTYASEEAIPKTYSVSQGANNTTIASREALTKTYSVSQGAKNTTTAWREALTKKFQEMSVTSESDEEDYQKNEERDAFCCAIPNLKIGSNKNKRLIKDFADFNALKIQQAKATNGDTSFFLKPSKAALDNLSGIFKKCCFQRLALVCRISPFYYDIVVNFIKTIPDSLLCEEYKSGFIEQLATLRSYKFRNISKAKVGLHMFEYTFLQVTGTARRLTREVIEEAKEDWTNKPWTHVFDAQSWKKLTWIFTNGKKKGALDDLETKRFPDTSEGSQSRSNKRTKIN
jgi:hypothetical protein